MRLDTLTLTLICINFGGEKANEDNNKIFHHTWKNDMNGAILMDWEHPL